MKAKVIKTKIAAAVLVSAALLLISLNAGSGGLEPNAPPGPTMHTLEEIYTAVTTTPEPEPRPFSAFMKFEGVDGESADSKHQDWIDILSWKWGITAPTPGTIGKAEAKDFTLTKWIDKASPLLYLACCTGTEYDKVTFNLVEPTGEREQYMQFNMHKVFITSVTGPGGGSPSPTTVGDSSRPIEEVSLNYGKIEWTYTVLDSNGTPTGQSTYSSFDFTTSTPY